MTSALAYRVSGEERGPARQSPLIVAPGMLAHEGDVEIVTALREAGMSSNIYSLLPPRGVYHGIRQCGVRWFHRVEDSLDRTSFGDALWHLERFVLDRLEESAHALPILVGAGDGATLALCAAPYLHDRILGLIALGGSLPTGSWWQPQPAPLQRLPVWLITGGGPDIGDCGEAAQWLMARGASVKCTACAPDARVTALRDGIGAWLAESTKREIDNA